MSSHRLDVASARIDRSKPLSFTFDGTNNRPPAATGSYDWSAQSRKW